MADSNSSVERIKTLLDNLGQVSEVNELELEVENNQGMENFRNKIDNQIKGIMEVDLSSDVNSSIRQVIQQLSREELEELILRKVVESLNSHSAVGALRSKLLSLYTIKDKFFLRSAALSKQVTELSKAMQLILDNKTRGPKTKEPTAALRFYRSVGVQVSTDPTSNIAPKRINQLKNWACTTRTTLKTENRSQASDLTPFTSATNNIKVKGQMMGPKMTPTMSAEVAMDQKSETNPWVAKKARVSPPPSVLRNQQQKVYSNRMKNLGTQKARNGLTNAPAQKMANGPSNLVNSTDESKKQNAPSVIVGKNGLQYRLLKPGGMQLQQSSTGYHTMTQAGQIRPLTLPKQMGNETGMKQQPPRVQLTRSQFQTADFSNVVPKPPMLRGAMNSAPRSILVHSNNVMGNLGEAMASLIPTNLHNMNYSPKNITLPALPPMNLENKIVLHRGQAKVIPSKPELTVEMQNQVIVMSWSLQLGPNNAEVQFYQIFVFIESLNPTAPLNAVNEWKNVGCIRELPLSKTFKLHQFVDENRYHFILRGIDVYNRTGPFCDPVAVVLKK